jgi:hypothetical protein
MHCFSELVGFLLTLSFTILAPFRVFTFEKKWQQCLVVLSNPLSVTIGIGIGSALGHVLPLGLVLLAVIYFVAHADEALERQYRRGI